MFKQTISDERLKAGQRKSREKRKIRGKPGDGNLVTDETYTGVHAARFLSLT